MDWTISSFGRHLDRSSFDCGKPSLNDYLATKMGQYEDRRIARNFIATKAGELKVCGFYSLSSGELNIEHLPKKLAKKLPRHPVPIALLGRLAVDVSVQGQGLGGVLLGDALLRCRRLSDEIGIFAIFVEAIDDESIAFYKHHGFTALHDQPRQLFRRIDDIPLPA